MRSSRVQCQINRPVAWLSASESFSLLIHVVVDSYVVFADVFAIDENGCNWRSSMNKTSGWARGCLYGLSCLHLSFSIKWGWKHDWMLELDDSSKRSNVKFMQSLYLWLSFFRQIWAHLCLFSVFAYMLQTCLSFTAYVKNT